MYQRPRQTDSIDSRNCPISELCDSTVLQDKNGGEVAIFWNPELWSKDKKQVDKRGEMSFPEKG
jgi:hypothetical protein